MKYLNYLLLFSALAVLGSCGSEETGPAGSPTGPTIISTFEPAPAFSIQTTSDETLESSQFEDKVLAIFFFGADCPPCQRAGPDIEAMVHQEFITNPDFAMIGADQWNQRDAEVDNFIDVTGISFPVGRLGAEMARDFGTTFDRMVVVNRAGEIVYRSPSRVSSRLQEAIDVIQDLL